MTAEEVKALHLFYSAQQPGLDEHSAACLRADIEGLRVSAGVHRVVDGGAVGWMIEAQFRAGVGITYRAIYP